MELDVTWQRLARIWWAWFWRSLLATLVGWVFAFLAGLWLGALASLLQLPAQFGFALSAFFGLMVAMTLSAIPLWQILGRDYGEFRLVLLAKR